MTTNATMANGPATTARPQRFTAPQLSGEDTLRVAARHDATAERRRYDAGFHQGHADGYAQGAEDVHAAIADHRRNAERLASLCHAIETAIAERNALDDGFIASVEEAVLSMSLDIAAAVIGSEVTQRDFVVDTIRRCLTFDRSSGGVAVRVHPEDLACAVEAIDVGLIDGTGADLVADPTIERGGCVVEAPTVHIDGQFGPALQRIRDALRAD